MRTEILVTFRNDELVALMEALSWHITCLERAILDFPFYPSYARWGRDESPFSDLRTQIERLKSLRDRVVEARDKVDA